MFITNDALELDDRNIFTATEVATVRGVFNIDLMKAFLEKNKWVNEYFPNYNCCDPYLHSPGFKVNNRESYFQKIIEWFFSGSIGNSLNRFFKNIYLKHWEKEYKELAEAERNRIFKSTDTIAKTHPEDNQNLILEKYYKKLKQYNLQNG